MTMALIGRLASVGLAILVLLASRLTVRADEIRLLVPAAQKPALAALVAAFVSTLPHRVRADYVAGDHIDEASFRRSSPDVVIDESRLIHRLLIEAKLRIGANEAIARVVLGMAGPKASRVQLRPSRDGYVRILKSSQFIVVPLSAASDDAGAHIDRINIDLGLNVELSHKLRLVNDNDVLSTIVELGRAAIGIAPVPEIIGDGRIRLIGELPNELQRIVELEAAMTMASRVPAEAIAFIAFLRSSRAAAVMSTHGWKPVDR